MAEPSFQDILSETAIAEPPAALPVGEYLAIVDGPAEITEVGKNNYKAAIFNMKPIQAQSTVDQSALLEALNGSSLQDKKIRYTMWLTPDARWRLDAFLGHLGVKEGISRGERIAEAMGKQVLITVGHRTGNDGKQVFADIKSTAKV
jgi:hypothetical protein